MPTAKSPLRLDAEIAASAAETAPRMSRSVAEQVSHWARLGRELERSPQVSLAEVEAVLDGSADYDALSVREQAVVRTAWVERMEELRSSLRMDEIHEAADTPYAALDAEGSVVVREPGGIGSSTERPRKAARKSRR